jgi:hypothetical protein
MGWFEKGKEGGTLASIRSPEHDYLVWKWRPSGEAGTTNREQSIRWGSSLRVRDGEVAVFVYSNNGEQQEFIEGPFDQTLKTANLPILANIIGLAYGGDSPFQASVYFINRAGTQTLPFRLPWFDVAESQPNLGTFTVPCAVEGTVYFAIDDYRSFIKMNRLTDFDTDRLRAKILPMLQSRIKGVVTNIGAALNIPVVQLERAIDAVRDESTKRLRELFEKQFGTRIVSVEISAIRLNKDDPAYKQLKSITTDQVAATEATKGQTQRQNLIDMQEINAVNVDETARIQREQLEFAQRLQSETSFIGAHALDKQAEVLKAAAQSLGAGGTVGGSGGGGGGGFNPAGVIMSVGLGGMMAGQMSGMLASMGTPGMLGALGTPGGGTPPPPSGGMPPAPTGGPAVPPQIRYFMAAGDKQYGPFGIEQMQTFRQTGQLTAAHLVWREGLASWSPASQLPDLAPIFGATSASLPEPPPFPPTDG